MKKILHTLVAGLIFASVSFSSVAEPIALNETEMDDVTAGAAAGFAASFAAAAGAGLFLGSGATLTFSNVTVTPGPLVDIVSTTTASASSAVGL